MGNAHVTDVKRMGFRSGPEAETHWIHAGEHGFEFDPHDGIEPAQLVAELHVDRTLKLEQTRFKWIAEDSFAAPLNFCLAETTVPVVMETLTTFCSLPRAWPSGKYRVEVYFGDEQTECNGSLAFAVRPGDNQMKSATLTKSVDGTEVEGDISRDAGPLRILFIAHYLCHVRKESFIEWIADGKSLLKLAVPIGTYDRFHSDISLDQPWPAPCAFEARLILDGHLVQTKKFGCIDGWICMLQPAELKTGCGPISAKFSHGAVLHFNQGMEIMWTYKETTQIAVVPLEAGDYNEASSKCQLDGKPWPVGPYAVTLVTNGVIICKKEFEIME